MKNNRNSFIGDQRLIHRQDYSRDPLVSPLKMKTLFRKNGTVLLLNSLMKTAGFQRSFNNKTLHFRGNAGFSL